MKITVKPITGQLTGLSRWFNENIAPHGFDEIKHMHPDNMVSKNGQAAEITRRDWESNKKRHNR